MPWANRRWNVLTILYPYWTVISPRALITWMSTWWTAGYWRMPWLIPKSIRHWPYVFPAMPSISAALRVSSSWKSLNAPSMNTCDFIPRWKSRVARHYFQFLAVQLHFCSLDNLWKPCYNHKDTKEVFPWTIMTAMITNIRTGRGTVKITAIFPAAGPWDSQTARQPPPWFAVS